MMRAVRLASLRDMVCERGVIAVDDAAGELEVSPETIRCDFGELAHQGLVQRTYGGVAAFNRERCHRDRFHNGGDHDLWDQRGSKRR